MRLALTLLSAVCFLTAFPLPASHFRSSSRLASGRWAKVKVRHTGMQLISNSTLRSLGFNNPDDVKVYGFGGRMLPERIDASMPDDLPPVRSVRTAAGILFFGHSSTAWAPARNGYLSYTHTTNAYSDNSYYFISDSDFPDNPDTGTETPPHTTAAPTAGSGETITVFTERLLHESELIAPANSGRLLLGEDFRTQESRIFRFDLPDNTGDARIMIAFGARVTNGQSAILAEANGTQLPATTADVIPGIGSSDTFLNMAYSPKTVCAPGERLDLKITYTYSGAIFTGALDYIRVEYPRALRLRDNELYFHLSPESDSEVAIEGCSGATVIWDVSDPAAARPVAHTLEGSSARFVTPAGYHEYVAFNPEEISCVADAAGIVANQDLHALSAPDMLLISPEEYRGAAERIARLHRDIDGMDVAVLSPEKIYNEFSSGNPDVTAFRMLLKMWHDREGASATRYCLILSRPTYDNKGVTAARKSDPGPRVPIWQSAEGLSQTSSYSTDDYIGMLEDCGDTFRIDDARIDVAVGRMPVRSVAEAEAAAAKLEKYLREPDPGPWRNSVMVIADDQDNAIHLEQAEDAIAAMASNPEGNGHLYEKLYLDSYPLSFSSTGAAYPQARKRMLDRINDGVAFVNYIGHANPREWGHEKLLTWTDIENLSNRRLPFIYAATCEFLRWDDDDISGGEKLWLKPESGVIGMICPSRKVYISLNGDLNTNTSRHMFATAPDGGSMRIGDIMTAGKNDTPRDDNKLRYALMGDPALRLPTPVLRIRPDTVAGIATDRADTLPVLKARQKTIISGCVTDRDGNIAEDFNGTLELQLFDAETVVETYGNGETGKATVYNDRKTRLAVAKAQVAGGRWSCPVILPMEVENNFSPALLSMYAYDADCREANGSFTGFYVYGFDEESPGDIEGPEFRNVYLNTPSFADGDYVSPYPVLYAELSDVSGINVSDAGLGHRMTLTVDGSGVMTDVASYFTPDPGAEGGAVRYPLPVMQPGTHTLSLTAWDNAGNSSTATLGFKVKADWSPSITGLGTDVNPAVSSVRFLIDTDADDIRFCRLEVFDLSGRTVWTTDSSGSGGARSISVPWDLVGTSGGRVPRGIYIYRATLLTGDGTETSRSGKLVVAAG